MFKISNFEQVTNFSEKTTVSDSLFELKQKFTYGFTTIYVSI